MDTKKEEYFEAWDTMPEDLRESLRERGCGAPDWDSGCTSRPNYSEIVIADQPSEVFETEEQENRYLAGLRRIIGELLDDPLPRLGVECISLVTGICYTGDSMTAIGERYGVSRAAVSKRCVELSDILGLHHSRAMRKLADRETYRQQALEQHSKAAPDQPCLFPELNDATPAPEFTGQTYYPQINRLLKELNQHPVEELNAVELETLRADLRPLRELVALVDRLIEKESI